MNEVFYITGNVFCAECGMFLTPEFRRLADGSMEGTLIVRGHKSRCSLFHKLATLRLPKVQILEIKEGVQ